jgi:ADP-ribose pyrophosphatase
MNPLFLQRIYYYLEFAKMHPSHFQNNLCSVKIILDPTEINQVEQEFRSRNMSLGLPEDSANVGIVSQDPWVTVVRDAVQFADGSRRLHTRTMNRCNEGSAVLPLFNREIILVRHFRHALRKSILEIPRGAIDNGATSEEAARQELREEIGGIAGELIPLGFIYGTTNLSANGSYLYFTRLQTLGAAQVEEGIDAIESYTIREVEALISKGEIQETHTIAAFCKARLRGLL